VGGLVAGAFVTKGDAERTENGQQNLKIVGECECRWRHGAGDGGRGWWCWCGGWGMYWQSLQKRNVGGKRKLKMEPSRKETIFRTLSIFVAYKCY
jgi:hypothetical protein